MFITLEGIEGAGKTSQIREIARFLEGRGHECLITREPGDTPIGRKIRSILLDPENKALTSMAELFLYAADRAQHLEERVLPALAAGKTVISDRFHDATRVYQGAARGIDTALIDRINRLVLGDLVPDLTLLFDLPPETGLARAWKQLGDGERDDRESRFEAEALSFHEKVRAGYLRLAESEPARFRVVHAEKGLSEVTEQVLAILGREIPALEARSKAVS